MDDCLLVLVESRPVVENRLVRTAFARFYRAHDSECPAPSDVLLPAVGRWHSYSATTEPVEQWRIQDGNWFVDVQRNERIGYATVERIVLTARRKGLVERCAQNSMLRAQSSILRHDAGYISNVQSEDLGEYRIATSGPRQPWALGGSGIVVIVKVTPQDVELVRCSIWES